MKTYNAALELETASAFEKEIQARFDTLVTEHLEQDAWIEAHKRFKAWKVSQLAPIEIAPSKRDQFCSDS